MADDGLSVEIEGLLSNQIVVSQQTTLQTAVSGFYTILGDMSSQLFTYRVTYGVSNTMTLDFSTATTKKIVFRMERFEIRSSSVHVAVEMNESQVPKITSYSGTKIVDAPDQD